MYRFGFQGQEKDDEITGVTGSHYTATFWQYDSRLGRRWNVDPVDKYHESPYACFASNPILFTDVNGDNATKYEDKDGNLLLETNDGSDDVVRVSDDKLEDFKYYGKSYQNDGMKPVYDSKGWNDNNKADLIGFKTTNEMNSKLDQLNSQWSRNAAIKYWQTGETADFFSFAYKEVLSQWTNPYLVVGGATIFVSGLTPKPNPKQTIYRGVNENHPGYANALEGTAAPRGGNATPGQHTAGNTNSIYTSWTKDIDVATNFATRPKGGGVVLEVTTTEGVVVNNSKQVILKQTGKLVSEKEVLMQGIVKGANATKVK